MDYAMRYGIVDANGAVVNVIEYSETPTQPPPGFGEGYSAVQSDEVGPGWTYIDGILAAPPQPPSPPLPPVSSVTPRQARLALLNAGLLSQVQAAVGASEEATKISWDFATVINRDDPLIIAIGSALDLSSEQIDALFESAATL
jgi:hypothetical protein